MQNARPSKEVGHIIEAWGLDLGQKFGGPYGSAGKDLSTGGVVAELNDLVPPGEDHRVVSHDGAAPYGGNANLMGLAGLTRAVAVVDVLGFIGQGSGRAAGDGG